MGNEIYKEQNKQPHSPEATKRINSDIEELKLYTNEGSITDLCCGNCDVGLYLNADYFYDLYPSYYFVDTLNLAEDVPNTLLNPTTRKANNVFMFHALEHFENPEHVLSRIRQFLLEDHGRLFLAVPDASFTDDENGYKPFDESIGHKFAFNMDILRLMLENAGFEVVMMKLMWHEGNPDFHEILAVAEKV